MRFVSKHDNHRIVIEARKKITINNNPVLTSGKSAQFKNGVFETQDQEIVDWMLSYKRCGIDYHPDVSQNKMVEKKGVLDELAEETTEEAKPKKPTARKPWRKRKKT